MSPGREQALIARDPPSTLPQVAAPPASRDPGIRTRAADDLPASGGDAVVPAAVAEADAVAVEVLSQVCPLGALLAKHEGPALSSQRPDDAGVDIDLLPVTHHFAPGRQPALPVAGKRA